MKLYSIALAAAAFATLPAAAAVDLQQIERKATEVSPKVLAWRRDFHQHPELSNREFRTAGKVAAHLESLGMEVTAGVAHTAH